MGRNDPSQRTAVFYTNTLSVRIQYYLRDDNYGAILKFSRSCNGFSVQCSLRIQIFNILQQAVRRYWRMMETQSGMHGCTNNCDVLLLSFRKTTISMTTSIQPENVDYEVLQAVSCRSILSAVGVELRVFDFFRKADKTRIWISLSYYLIIDRKKMKQLRLS